MTNRPPKARPHPSRFLALLAVLGFLLIAAPVGLFVWRASKVRPVPVISVFRNGAMTEPGLFSEAPRAWELVQVQQGKVRVVRDTQTFADAPSALRVDAVGQGFNAALVSQTFRTNGNAPLTVNANLRVAGDASGALALRFYPRPGQPPQTFVLKEEKHETPSWVPIQQTVTLPPGIGAEVALLVTGQGKVWLDSVTVTGAGVQAAIPADLDPSVAAPVPGPGWQNSFEQQRAEAKAAGAKARIVFIGDSLTRLWPVRAPALWQERYAAKGALNLGSDGDATGNILWRVEHGALDGLTPRVVVLMAGTNNLWHDEVDPLWVAEGVATLVRAIRQRIPKASVLLMGIPPTQPNASHPLRLRIQAINTLLKKLDDGTTIHFVDIGASLLDSDGTLSREISPDSVHLSEKGYQIWADAIDPLVGEELARVP